MAVDDLLKVVLFLLLLQITHTEDNASNCSFEFYPVSSLFIDTIQELKNYTFTDYQIRLDATLEENDQCSDLWKLYIYSTALNKTLAKAQPGVAYLLQKVLLEISFVKECQFKVADTCHNLKQPMIDVLDNLIEILKHLKNKIDGSDFNHCTLIRCPSGQSTNTRKEEKNEVAPRKHSVLLLVIIVLVLAGVLGVVFWLCTRRSPDNQANETPQMDSSGQSTA